MRKNMSGYTLKVNNKKAAKVYGRSLPISTKNSVEVCKAISGMNVEKGKKLLMDMLNEKRSIKGKYYTNATFEILKLINSAESNAEFKGLDADKMVIHASANEGYTFFRPRRFKMRGRRKKITHVQIVLEAK